jgi:hypothetical protein
LRKALLRARRLAERFEIELRSGIHSRTIFIRAWEFAIMKSIKTMLAVTFALGVMASAGSAVAHDEHGRDGDGKEHHRAAVAPELASKGAPVALALVAGGVAIVVARRRRQS